MTDNITLPRAVVWRLHAAFRDADKTIRPSGEKSDYSAEIAVLDAALAEPEPEHIHTCGSDCQKPLCANRRREIAAAVEAEREACAEIADSVDNYANPMTARDCAEAIRARGSK
jgi:hypothetical protein